MKLTVLTGDIVNSTALGGPELNAVLSALQSAAECMCHWPDTTAWFARRGGDGWQVALTSEHFDLRAALFLQASLRRLEKTYLTRIAIATGDGFLNPNASIDLNAASGPAFVQSGRLLDQITGQQSMAHAFGGPHAATISLADHIAQGWTQAQARALYEILPPNSGPRTEAAKRLGISRPAVDQALWSAGYLALDRALEAWENPPQTESPIPFN